jgi:hypothetical protein
LILGCIFATKLPFNSEGIRENKEKRKCGRNKNKIFLFLIHRITVSRHISLDHMESSSSYPVFQLL